MSAWVKELRKLLDEAGVSYEIEEGVRVHLGNIVVEAGESTSGKYAVTVSMQLPSEAGLEDVDSYVNDFKIALSLVSKLKGQVAYELDTSLPDYPTLRIIVEFRDPLDMAKALGNAVKSLVEEGVVEAKQPTVEG